VWLRLLFHELLICKQDLWLFAVWCDFDLFAVVQLHWVCGWVVRLLMEGVVAWGLAGGYLDDVGNVCLRLEEVGVDGTLRDACGWRGLDLLLTLCR
jgi:hypothetical protein